MGRQLWIRTNPSINKSPVQDNMNFLKILLNGQNVIELHVTIILIESFRFDYGYDYDYEIFYSNLPSNHAIFLRHHALAALESLS